MTDKNMIEIIESLNEYDDYDIYIKEDSEYKLYKSKGYKLQDVGYYLISENRPTLYITLEDKFKKISYLNEKFNEQLKINLRQDLSTSKIVLTEVISTTLEEPRSEILIALKDTINIFVEEYLAHPGILKNLTNIYIKDYSTSIHLVNIMLFCIGFAHYNNFHEHDIKQFGLMGLLHDVGKLNTPDIILKSVNPLSDNDFDVIKKHPIDSYNILKKCEFKNNKIALSALEHHEKLDGSGYPYNKTSEHISKESKILSIIDIFEALTHIRPYRVRAYKPLDALKIIKEEVDMGKLDKELFESFVYSMISE